MGGFPAISPMKVRFQPHFVTVLWCVKRWAENRQVLWRGKGVLIPLFVVANSPDECSIGASTTTLIVADFLHCQTKMGVYRGFRVVLKRISFPLKWIGKEIQQLLKKARNRHCHSQILYLTWEVLPIDNDLQLVQYTKHLPCSKLWNQTHVFLTSEKKKTAVKTNFSSAWCCSVRLHFISTSH